jgi:hypothetical protein
MTLKKKGGYSMTDLQLFKEILKRLKLLTFRQLAEIGVNAQQAQRIKTGLPVVFRTKTIERLRKKFHIAA